MLSKNGQFSMFINSGGNALAELENGTGTFVVGPKGDTFSLNLRNTSSRRVIVMINIDGFCTIDGLDLLGEDVGYILEPGVLVTIDCWRFKTGQCLPLQFGRLPGGFIEENDETGNQGVIEAIFFNEETDPDHGSMTLGLNFKTLNHSGWGSQNEKKVVREHFVKKVAPESTITIMYVQRSKL